MIIAWVYSTIFLTSFSNFFFEINGGFLCTVISMDSVPKIYLPSTPRILISPLFSSPIIAPPWVSTASFIFLNIACISPGLSILNVNAMGNPPLFYDVILEYITIKGRLSVW